MSKMQTGLLLYIVFAFFASSFGLAAEKRQAGEIEMHHPKGWQFTMPKGDVTKGREAFEKFACYVCHEIRGEKFPPRPEVCWVRAGRWACASIFYRVVVNQPMLEASSGR
jgi:hypothetical protein